MTNNDTEIALLKQKQESQDKDIRKLEERQQQKLDDFKQVTKDRFDKLEGIHNKIMWGIGFGIVSFLAWFGKIVAGKIGL